MTKLHLTCHCDVHMFEELSFNLGVVAAMQVGLWTNVFVMRGSMNGS